MFQFSIQRFPFVPISQKKARFVFRWLNAEQPSSFFTARTGLANREERPRLKAANTLIGGVKTRLITESARLQAKQLVEENRWCLARQLISGVKSRFDRVYIGFAGPKGCIRNCYKLKSTIDFYDLIERPRIEIIGICKLLMCSLMLFT